MIVPSPAPPKTGKVPKNAGKVAKRGSTTVAGGSKAVTKGLKTVARGSKPVPGGAKSVAKATSRGSKTVSGSARVEDVRYPKAFETLLEATGDAAGGGAVASGAVKVSVPSVLAAYLDAWKTGDASLLRPVTSPAGAPEYPAPLQSLLLGDTTGGEASVDESKANPKP